MAINWKTAQNNEKKFWENVYIKNDKDLVYSKTSNEGWAGFAKKILARHQIKIENFEKKKILDLGSGPGGIVLGLKELIGGTKDCQFICADPLMNFFKEKICILKEGQNLKLLNAEGENLPLKDKSIDIIFCTNVLDHCRNPGKVISEVRRILKDDGIFYPSLHLVYDYLFIFKNFIKLIDKNHPHHLTKKDIKKILKKNFSTVTVTDKKKIIHDQPLFTFKNIFKNKDKIRGIKRFLSNYVLYTSYFVCKN